MTVIIPILAQHNGYEGNLGAYEIPDLCECGGTRGIKRWKGFSYDGSLRLIVDCWENSCGHIDKYSLVREIGKRVSYPTSIQHPVTSNQQ